MGNTINIKHVQDYQARPATIDELHLFVENAEKQGWNPALYDIQAIHKYDPSTFYVGLFKNEIVCLMSLVIYANNFAFIGFVICKPEYRGRLYAIALAKIISNRLSGQNVGLDSVFLQIPLYQKNGFKSVYKTIRYECFGTNQKIENQSILPISQFDFNEVVHYDSQVFPCQRSDFLKEWINIKDSITVGYRKDGKIVGFGNLQKLVNGYCIGPLFADDLQIAKQIFEYMKGEAEQKSRIFINIPSINAQAIKLAQLLSLKQFRQLSRMYTKGLPRFQYNKIFGITSPQFG